MNLKKILIYTAFFSSTYLQGVTTSWVAVGFNDWEIPANWNNGVPDANLDAVIDNGGAVSLDATGNAKSLGIGISSTTNNLLLLQNQNSRLTTDGCVIGSSLNSNGSLQVGAADAVWINFGNALIGGSGNANVSIFNGFASTGSTSIAENPSSFGIVTVDGGSWLCFNLLIAGSGNGNIRIINGGNAATLASALIAAQPDGDGTALVDGSNWFSSAIIVGSKGTGLLTSINGSVVSSVLGAVALYEGSTANVFLTNGGQWINSTTMSIGSEGTANILVDTGGHLFSPFIQFSNSILNLNGTAGNRGTLTTNALEGVSGIINIDGGVLQAVGNNGSFVSGFSSGGLNIAGGGVFVDTQSFDAGITSPFSGPGSLTKIGAGRLILGGANSYTGGTIVSEGTLQGDSTSLQGNIITDSTLVFNQIADGTFAGSLQGSGTLVKEGSAKLQLIGNNSGFNGVTQVIAGNLNVNGILGGSSLVNQGGILSGNGRLNFLSNKGIVAPGNSIGTLHVVNFVNQPSGVYAVEINPNGAASLIDASGTVVLQGGEVAVTTQPGIYYKGMQWTIIQAAGGLFGQFAGLMQPNNLTLGLTYLPNSLILTALTNSLNISCLRGNALRTAEYLINLDTFSPDLLYVFETLNTLNCRQLSRALNQLDPSLFAALPITVSDTTHMINTTFVDRLDYLRRVNCENTCQPCQKVKGAWIAGSADFVRQQKSQGLRRFTSASEGVSLGYDNLLNDSLYAGLGLAYSHSNLHWGNSAGKANINSYYIGAYASQTYGICYLDASLLAFVDHNRVRRHIHFSEIERKGKNNHYSYGISPHVGIGAILDYGCFAITPFFDFDYYLVQQNRCREHGANSLNLHVRRNQSQLARVEFGASITRAFTVFHGILQPEFSLSWVGHRLIAGRRYFSAFEGIGHNFSVFGTDQCFNQIDLGAGLTYLINDRLGINLWYDAELGHKRQEQQINLEANFAF